MSETQNIRNVAIIAHVDHGKTTLVDAMLRGAGTFRSNEQVATRVMDSNDLEKERGITILAKNTAIHYGDAKINIVDTPGHADFGGEVERVLKMVEGVLLVVDAFDGPMPQTRFVLHKALDLGLKVCVVINKVDRPDARPEEVVDMLLDLFIELDADEAQLEFPMVYASARDGYAAKNLEDLPEDGKGNMFALLDMILEAVPAPVGNPEGPLQMLVSNIDYDPYIGRIAVGKIERGKIRSGQALAITKKGEEGFSRGKAVKLMRFEGLGKVEAQEALAGEIVCVAGLSDIEIGETLCDIDHVEALDFVKIDEPTIAMTFVVNDSPLAGREGKFLTSRHIRDRLLREMEKNVSMIIEPTDSADAFVVKGRGELSLSILIETMRREGYELQVSKPQVIVKEDEDGKKLEPIEEVFIDVPEEYVGTVIEKLGTRKAEMTTMKPPHRGYTRMIFEIPSRGLIGYRSELLTDTKGNGIMNSVIKDFQEWKGEIETRKQGVLVATESGEAVTYGLHGAQERGELFISAGEAVYEGMIVGRCPKNEDVSVNVCKKKHVTNMRAAGSDDALRLVTPTRFSLEQCLEFVDDDELIEVTPQNIRLRKRILNTEQRAKARSRKK